MSHIFRHHPILKRWISLSIAVFYILGGENGAFPPTRTVQSIHFWAKIRFEIGLKNGAYPFNSARNAEKRLKKRSIAVHLLYHLLLKPRFHTKTEHCRSVREMQVANCKPFATEKRSISVHKFPWMTVRSQKTEHIRSLFHSFHVYCMQNRI